MNWIKRIFGTSSKTDSKETLSGDKGPIDSKSDVKRSANMRKVAVGTLTDRAMSAGKTIAAVILEQSGRGGGYWVGA